MNRTICVSKKKALKPGESAAYRRKWKHERKSSVYALDLSLDAERLWIDRYPSLAASWYCRDVDSGPNVMRHRIAEMYPPYICRICGHEETPANYADPGLAGDLRRRKVCWSCDAALYVQGLATQENAEVDGDVLYVDGAAVAVVRVG